MLFNGTPMLYMEIFYSVLGQACIGNFAYAQPVTQTINDGDAELIMNAIEAAVIGTDDEVPSIKAYSACLPASSTIYKTKLYFRYDAAKDALKREIASSVVGLRSVAGTSLYPPNVVLSAYASRQSLGGHGAKQGISNLLLSDVGNNALVAGAGKARDTAQLMFDVFFQDGAWPVGSELAGDLYPVVVPRVEYTTPSGNPSNRLPFWAGDPWVSYTINPFSIAPNTGTRGSRKMPLRPV